MQKTKRDILSRTTKEVESSKFVARNTLRIKYKDGSEAIRLHDTDVVTFLPSGEVQLNSGGWRTVTTKERINQFANTRMYQEKGVWYVGGSVFYDNMVLKNGKAKKVLKPNLPAIEKMKKKIAKFVALITKDNLPIPDSGDCWYCSLHTKEGEPMGEAFKSHDHLLEHLKEGYLHGSLLVNAMREAGYRDEQIGFHYQLKCADTFKRAVRKYLQKRLIKDIAVK